MPSNLVKILWILLWSLVAAGWSVLSFRWLRKNIESLMPELDGKKSGIQKVLVRRISVFLMIGLLLFLALKTEPLAAIAMVVVITVTTWTQVILYNQHLNRESSRKEKDFGSN